MQRRRRHILTDRTCNKQSPYETLSDLSLASLGLLLILVVVSLAIASPRRSSEFRNRLKMQLQIVSEERAALTSERRRDMEAEVRAREEILQSHMARITEVETMIDEENREYERLQVDLRLLLKVRTDALATEGNISRYRVELERLKLKLQSFERFETGISIDRSGRPHMKYGTASHNGQHYYLIGGRRWAPDLFRAVLNSIRSGQGHFFIQWEHAARGDWRRPDWARRELRSWGWIAANVEKKEGY